MTIILPCGYVWDGVFRSFDTVDEIVNYGCWKHGSHKRSMNQADKDYIRERI
jgi:hypothetical protein